eukprot:PhF_6_TR43399/c0_g1_i1/m.66637
MSHGSLISFCALGVGYLVCALFETIVNNYPVAGWVGFAPRMFSCGSLGLLLLQESDDLMIPVPRGGYYHVVIIGLIEFGTSVGLAAWYWNEDAVEGLFFALIVSAPLLLILGASLTSLSSFPRVVSGISGLLSIVWFVVFSIARSVWPPGSEASKRGRGSSWPLSYTICAQCIAVTILCFQHFMLTIKLRQKFASAAAHEMLTSSSCRRSSSNVTSPMLPPPSATNFLGLGMEQSLMIASAHTMSHPSGVDNLQPSNSLTTTLTKEGSASTEGNLLSAPTPNSSDQCASPNRIASGSRVRPRLNTSSVGMNQYVSSPKNVTSKTLSWKRGAVLGQGAFGSVHIALNNDTGELMAVKHISFDPSDPNLESKIKMLQNEIMILKKFQHEQIVQYYFVEKVENGINIFLEYVSGGSILNLIRSIGPLDELVVVQYSHQILKGLEYLHENNILHGDIKSANILLTVNGSVKVADFGSATIVEEALKGIGGTPVWMAPEVVRGEPLRDFSSDIWSFGCTVMEMLTGTIPWAHIGNPVTVLQYVAGDDALNFPKNISPLARSFLECCLQRDPSKRSTAKELLEHPFFLEDDTLSSDTDNTGQQGSAPQSPMIITIPNHNPQQSEEQPLQNDTSNTSSPSHSMFMPDKQPGSPHKHKNPFQSLRVLGTVGFVASMKSSTRLSASIRATAVSNKIDGYFHEMTTNRSPLADFASAQQMKSSVFVMQDDSQIE